MEIRGKILQIISNQFNKEEKIMFLRLKKPTFLRLFKKEVSYFQQIINKKAWLV